MSSVTAIPAADSATVLAHHEARLAVETDADDVASAIRDDAIDFTLLDVRSAAAHAAGHLPGARSLPHATIDAASVAALPPGPLVVYCWGPGCNAAHKAAAKLARNGRAAKEMIGGFEYYVREGWPVEGDAAAGFEPDRTGLVGLPRG